jgi:hypothetical protein
MPEDTPADTDDWDEEDAPLPASLRVFTSRELDTDEATARRAADEIRCVTCHLLDQLITLEHMDRALRDAEPFCARAHGARVGVRQAIEGFDKVIGGVSEARDALTFRWSS